MPRKLTTIEHTRAGVVWDLIAATSKSLCGMIYVPDLTRALKSQVGMSVEESIQAIRDLLSLQLLEMHFDQDLKSIPAGDRDFTFPPPGSGSSKAAYPLPFARLSHQKGKDLCGEDQCGANARDFIQPNLFLSGSFSPAFYSALVFTLINRAN